MSGNDTTRRGPLLSLVGQQKDLLFYSEEVERHPGSALVLGAGTGKLAWELASRGVQTVAVEPSPMMLATAEQRRATEAPEVSGRLQFLEADVRSVRLPERFAAVLAPQNALAMMGSLDELDALLASVRHHLLREGVFALDRKSVV